MNTGLVYFLNGPKEGMREYIENPGRSFVIKVVESPRVEFITRDTPIYMDDLMKVTQYTYVPIQRYVDADYISTWDYVLDSPIFNTLESSKPHATRKEYEIVRRPKMLEASHGKTQDT